MKLYDSITNREFKLLIKPDGLERRSKVAALTDLIVNFCKQNKVGFSHLDNAASGLRNVYFYDTPKEDFRRNNVILRVRESRQNIWVDDWCEVTLKYRSQDITETSNFDPVPKTKTKSRLRFKQEILRGDTDGSMRILYSSNAILDAVPLDSLFDRSLGSVDKFFPGLVKLPIDKKLPLRIVGGAGNKVLEVSLPIGNLEFKGGVQAHCDIAIWLKRVGQPIIGELTFSYRVTDSNRLEHKAHKQADRFFQNLQKELADWLQVGSTKTALIYDAQN